MQEPITAAHIVHELTIKEKELKEVKRFLTSTNLKNRMNKLLTELTPLKEEIRLANNIEYVEEISPDLLKYRLANQRHLIKIARQVYFQTVKLIEDAKEFLTPFDSGVDNRFIALYLHLPGTVFPNDLS